MNESLMIILCFIFSALFSGLETGCYSLNRIRLKRRVLERDKNAIRVQRFIARPYRFMFTVLIGNNIAIYLLSSQTTNIFLRKGFNTNELLFGIIPWNAEILATLILVFPVFIFCEILPKNYFRLWADKWMYFLSYLTEIIITILIPLTWTIEFLYSFLKNDFRSKPTKLDYQVSKSILKEQLVGGINNGVLTSDQSEMIDKVMTMNNSYIKENMMPIKKIPIISKNATVADFKKILHKSNLNDVFVRNRNQIIGYVSSRNIVLNNLNDDDKIFPLLQNITNININKSFKLTLNQLKELRSDYAVVTNKYGISEGVVNFEDIANYIVKI